MIETITLSKGCHPDVILSLSKDVEGRSKRYMWLVFILAMAIFPLPTGNAQEKSSKPFTIKTDKEKIQDVQSKILANMDTITHNYQAQIKDLKAQLAQKQTATAKPVQKKKSHKHKPAVTNVSDSTLIKYAAANSNWKLPVDTISTTAPILVAPKKEKFLKRLFSIFKKKNHEK